ncbi:MAG: SurA N-terminal domain-containing protein [Synergistaceae bacterium]|nr:SurA N-terminal domain-containing protein [Synergistaceae bacterium]
MNFLRKQMKWVMAIIVVAFLLSTFLMYEGRSTRRTPTRNADGTMSDYEVAQINGRSLMRSELERAVRNYLANNYSTRNLASLDMPAIYQTVLDQAILDSQLAKEVQEKGITVTDAEADRVMKNYADTYFPTREAFYQVLAQNGLKVDDYKRTIARQIATERLVREAIGTITASEDQAVEFYDTMKGLVYTTPEGFMIHAAQFNTSADAENFRARLVNGEEWTAILSSDSFDSKDVINITQQPISMPASALTSGVLSILASLDIKQPSPVFSMSSDDFTVAMKTEHYDTSVRPYNEVSGDIKALLIQQEERRRLNDYQTSLRSKAQVVINDESLFARPVVSEDNTPALDYDISVEEVSEDLELQSSEPTPDAKPEESPASEPVKIESPEVKPQEITEPAKSEDVKAPEVVSSEVKPVESESVDVITPEEIKSDDITPVKAPEVVSSEVKPVEIAEPAKSESADVITPEEIKSEDITPVKAPEVVSSEVKPVEIAEPAKSESADITAAVENIKSVDIQESVDEAVKEITEKVEEIIISSDKQ